MKFTVYSKNGCPYCDKVKKVLELTKLQHTVQILDQDFTREEFYSKFGDLSTFPQVVLNDDTNLGGCTDTVQFLKENNLV